MIGRLLAPHVRAAIAGICLMATASPGGLQAAPARQVVRPDRFAAIQVVAGLVEVQSGIEPFIPIAVDQALGGGDRVRVAEDGVAVLSFASGTRVQLTGGALVQFVPADPDSGVDVALSQERGVVLALVVPSDSGGFSLSTPPSGQPVWRDRVDSLQ